MLQRVNVCGATRILLPAFFVGMGVTAFTGNETAAWIVAGVVALGIWGVDRLRGTTAACALPIDGGSPEGPTTTPDPTIDLRASDPAMLRTSTVRSRTPQRKGA